MRARAARAGKNNRPCTCLRGKIGTGTFFPRDDKAHFSRGDRRLREKSACPYFPAYEQGAAARLRNGPLIAMT